MKKFLKGFTYAGKGIFYCFAHEMNMRVHLCFTVYMFCFLGLYDFFEISKAEYGVLLALCALVLSLEAVNTAIERVVDLTGERNPIAGAAKDAAAGAVLIAAIFSVIAGIVIMYQPAAFKKMFEYYTEHIGSLVVLIISLVLSVCFVLIPQRMQKKEK